MYTGLDEIEETLPELLATTTPIAKNLRHGAKILADKNVEEAELQLRHGEVAGEILREARIGDYDLIVTGSPQRNQPLARFFLGDVTDKVFELAPCSALMVKQKLSIEEKRE
jgi:nucleotide-binding universal stress UspA family protein